MKEDRPIDNRARIKGYTGNRISQFYVSPQQVEIDTWDMQEDSQTTGRLSARLIGVINSRPVAIAIEELGRALNPNGVQVPSQEIRPAGRLPGCNYTVNFGRLARKLNTDLAKLTETSKRMGNACVALANGIDDLQDGIGKIKRSAKRFKLA